MNCDYFNVTINKDLLKGAFTTGRNSVGQFTVIQLTKLIANARESTRYTHLVTILPTVSVTSMKQYQICSANSLISDKVTEWLKSSKLSQQNVLIKRIKFLNFKKLISF